MDMLMHMRTTIDLPDALLDQARAVAGASGGTVRELVIEGLGEVLARRSACAAPAFRLPDCAVAGQGLQPGIADLRWDTLRDLVHDEGGRWGTRA